MKVSRNGPAISHLFFADDCLLFAWAKSKQVRVIRDVLEKFCIASGLKVNVEKSKMFVSGNVPHTKRAKFPDISSIAYSSNFGKYLGFPILQ